MMRLNVKQPNLNFVSNMCVQIPIMIAKNWPIDVKPEHCNRMERVIEERNFVQHNDHPKNKIGRCNFYSKKI